MDNREFLKLVMTGAEVRNEVTYIHQIEIDGQWYAFASDEYTMHVSAEPINDDLQPVVAVEDISRGDSNKAAEFQQRNRKFIESIVDPQRDNPIEVYFDTDTLRRILDYARDEVRLDLIVQRPRKTEGLFDFSDGKTCFAFILVDGALFSLGNVHGTVEQNVTIAIAPQPLRRALDGVTALPDAKLVFDAAHLDRPVTFGDTFGRFAVVMPMMAPEFSRHFMADFIGGYGERLEVVRDVQRST